MARLPGMFSAVLGPTHRRQAHSRMRGSVGLAYASAA